MRENARENVRRGGRTGLYDRLVVSPLEAEFFLADLVLSTEGIAAVFTSYERLEARRSLRIVATIIPTIVDRAVRSILVAIPVPIDCFETIRFHVHAAPR